MEGKVRSRISHTLFWFYFFPLAHGWFFFLAETISRNQKEVKSLHHVKMDCKYFIETYVVEKEKPLRDGSGRAWAQQVQLIQVNLGLVALSDLCSLVTPALKASHWRQIIWSCLYPWALPFATTSWVLRKPGSVRPLGRGGWADWLFSIVHWGEIKGILGKKAELTKLSCSGKCCTQKLIVQGVGIPGFPTVLAKLAACFHLEGETDIN